MPWLVIVIYLVSLYCITEAHNTNDCYVMVNGAPKYYGTRNVTLSGIPCQRWDVTYPHDPKYKMDSVHENYCRNPDNYYYVWCYTIRPNLQWERCDIQQCDSTVVLPNTPIQSTSSLCDSIPTENPNIETEDNICPCEDRQLYWYNYFNGNLSQQTKEAMIKDEKKKIKKELFLDANLLSSYRNKKTCARDERTSSFSMGTASVVILATVSVLIILSDVLTLWKT